MDHESKQIVKLTKQRLPHFILALLQHHFRANIMGKIIIPFQSIEDFVIDFFGARIWPYDL